jgi:hypothetical protein
LLCIGLAGLTPVPAAAQIGNLIKKKAADAIAAQDPTLFRGEAVTFDDATVELTAGRIDRIIAGKRAARRLADGPNGPAAFDKKIQALNDRQTAVYNKYKAEITAAEEQASKLQNCRDSVLQSAQEQKRQSLMARASSDAEFVKRTSELAQAMLVAQQKGDTATMRKLQAEVEQLGALSPADSALALKGCSSTGGSPGVQEWRGLAEQIQALRKQRQNAEAAVTRAEQQESGLNDRQLATANERILMFLAALNTKTAQHGLTQEELDALRAASKDLKDVFK